MTVSEAAEKYNLSAVWVRKLAREGRLPGVQQVGPIYLIPEKSLQDYLAKERKPGPKPKRRDVEAF